MIEARLETTVLTAGRDGVLVVVLRNSGWQACRTIVFRLHLPPEIVLLRGSERVDLDRLGPGVDHRLSYRVRSQQAGTYCVTSPNFSYQDATGRARRIEDWQSYVLIEEPVQTPAERDAAEAETLERDRRWQEAWPLFVESGQGRRAWACLERAIKALTDHSSYIEAAEQSLAWAQAMRHHSDPYIKRNSKAITALEKAIEWFAQANRQSQAHQCRDLIAYITSQPLLDARIVATPDESALQGKPVFMSIEMINRGYGPARQVRLTLSGMLERPVEHELAELYVGQTVVWEASVIPSHAGPCTIKLAAVALPYGDGTPVTAMWQETITCQPAGLLERIDRLQDANVHVEIGNYATSGGVNLINQDSVLVNKAPLIDNSVQRPAGSPQPSAIPDQTTCPSCGARTEPAYKFCKDCGASLRPY